MVTPPMLSKVTVDEIHERLSRLMGEEKAEAVTRQTLAAIGLQSIRTPEDLLLFAQTLERQGGFVQFVGRSLKTQALLRGAKEPA